MDIKEMNVNEETMEAVTDATLSSGRVFGTMAVTGIAIVGGYCIGRYVVGPIITKAVDKLKKNKTDEDVVEIDIDEDGNIEVPNK